MTAPDATWLTRVGLDLPGFGEALRAADLDRPVAACPGWTVGDLAHHLGGTHRWVTAVLATGLPADEPPGSGDPRDWYDGGWPPLLEALRRLDPDAPCWGLGPPPRTAGFWRRRIAHETALHRADLDLAAGQEPAFEAPFAADGIGEIATVFLPRQIRLGRCPAPARAVAISAPQGDWVLGDGAPAATLHGEASDLLLTLWHRRPLDDRLTVTGDRSAVGDLLALPITP